MSEIITTYSLNKPDDPQPMDRDKFGIYNGSMGTVDQEAKGILQYTLPELKKEIKQSPDSFTHDIVFYLKNYKKEFEEFINIISQ